MGSSLSPLLSALRLVATLRRRVYHFSLPCNLTRQIQEGVARSFFGSCISSSVPILQRLMYLQYGEN